MKRRCVTSYRIAAPEALEPKIALSVTVGAMGDSYSDEYDASGFTGLYNWVETMVRGGRADFGPLTTFTDSGDPRYGVSGKSYEYNFAKGGATTSSYLGSSQFFNSPPRVVTNYHSQPGSASHPADWGGIRALGLGGTIEYASLEIGGNDILGNIGNGTYSNGLNLPALNAVFGRFVQGLDLATANGTSPLKMVLVTYPDLGSMPVATNGLLFPALNATQQQNVRANVQAYNGMIRNLADARDMAVVELWDWWEEARTETVSVHGIPIAGAQVATVMSPAQMPNFFIVDGVHPTPIGQALWANRFIEALRDHYGETGIEPLSSKELVTLTGLDPQVAPTASAGGPYTIAAGQSLALNASASSDANVGDRPLLVYRWDLDADGDFDDAQGAQPTLSWAQLQALGIAPGHTYVVRVQVDDTFGGVANSSPVELTITSDTTAPRLEGAPVRLSGTSSVHAEYSVPTGSGEQLRTIPVGTINRVRVTFSEDVVVSSDNLEIEGAGPIAVASFSYDAPQHTATWTLETPLLAGEYTLVLADQIVDAVGNALDGEWESPDSLTDPTASTQSGNGQSGGEFRFRFNVLPGDANRDNKVTGADYTIWADQFDNGAGAADKLFTDGDFTGDGHVTGADYTSWADNFDLNQTAPPVERGARRTGQIDDADRIVLAPLNSRRAMLEPPPAEARPSTETTRASSRPTEPRAVDALLGADGRLQVRFHHGAAPPLTGQRSQLAELSFSTLR